jgi:hypothetical protein
MVFDEDNYVFDAGGNRVLVGLTLDETREFESLDALIASLGSMSSTSRSPTKIRWLVLYEKHEAALEAFRKGSRTML